MAPRGRAAPGVWRYCGCQGGVTPLHSAGMSIPGRSSDAANTLWMLNAERSAPNGWVWSSSIEACFTQLSNSAWSAAG